MNIFELQNISKSFKSKQVFQNLNISIPEHGITCILGKNGAGKTTLIKCMLRLLTLDGGTILYNGQNHWTISEKLFYRKVAAVLEGNRNIYWYMTGMENLLYFGRQKGLSDGTIYTEASRLLTLFELDEAKDQKVGTYSRGMQQKLAIIIALLSKPEVLFLDEPTLGLDYVSKNTMVSILHELAKKMPILLTSHQMDVVERVCQHLILLHDGGLAFEGSLESFQQSRVISHPYKITVFGNVDRLQNNDNLRLESSEANIHTLSFYPTKTQSLSELLFLLQGQKLDVLNIEKAKSLLKTC